MDGGRSGTSLEPLPKRIRMETETTTTMTPSIPTPRAATPEVLTRGPSGPVTPAPQSLSATHGMQRSSSDMILDSDNETSPAPGLAKETPNENMAHDNHVPSSEQQPLAEPSLEPQTENPAAESPRQVMEETPMPPVQGLSLVSPEMKSNPFTASKIFLCSSVAPLVRATIVPDVGSLSLHSPLVHDTRDGYSTVASQASQQGSPTRKSYIFSPAEIRTLVASRGSDEGSGPNKLVFPLDWNSMNGITKWRNYKAGQG